MNTSSSFSLFRLQQLLKRDVLVDFRLLFFALLVILGILTLFVSFHIFDPVSDMRYFHEPAYLVLMFVGGTLFISSIFSELNSVEKRHVYLSIPATTLEKFISKWLIAAVIVPVLLTAIYFIFTIVINYMFYITQGVESSPFIIFSEFNIATIKMYYVAQSLFFLGAIVFNSFTFLKTGATIILTGAAITFLFWLILRIIVGPEVLSANFNNLYNQPGLEVRLADGNVSYLPSFFMLSFKYGLIFILPLLVTITAYFKLKEKTV